MIRSFFNKLTSPFDEAIAHPDDPDDVRLGKRLFVRFHLFMVSIALVQVIQGLIIADRTFAIISFLIFIPFFINLTMVGRGGRFEVHFSIFVLLIMVIPFLWSATFGGFNANAGDLWISFAPLLLIVLVFDRSKIIRWFLLFSILTIVSGFLEPYVANPEKIPSSHTYDIIFGSLLMAAITLLTLNYYKREKNSAQSLLVLEKEKSENLLLNILPKQIADILKKEERVIADRYDNASIMFADLSGFTPLSAEMEPEEMIDLLNTIYSHFDTLSDKYGVEKIRTIGDNYMVASGVPSPRQDHAQALAHMALDILLYCSTLPPQNGTPIRFRIGINSGALIAGVIGQKKFHYDVWGDTVNIASRMESHGVAGKIQMTAATRALLKDEFECEKRGVLDIKGKGEMETWFLLGRK
ncbi:MAG: adenylate/guanylate cyclase domain-containing protein [Chloroflexi bacterium]|nr:adenylate/guanylate cyclase domain-containing protein [Chloroflexota bacterium]